MSGLFMKSIFVALIATVVYNFMLKKKPQYDPADVKGLRVVVTGSSTGIGEQIAYKYASMGAKVLVTARTERKLQKVVKHCKELGAADAQYVATSMTSYTNASKVIDKAMEVFGGVDVLVLNHIASSYFGGFQYDAKRVEDTLMTNMLTHAHLASVTMNELKKNKGRIVVVSSLGGAIAVPFTVDYSTSKFALNGFFRSLRTEMAYNETDVSISIGYLGFIDTDSAKKLTAHISEELSPKEKCADEIVRGSMMRERDVYFPEKIGWIFLVKDLCPEILEKFARLHYHI